MDQHDYLDDFTLAPAAIASDPPRTPPGDDPDDDVLVYAGRGKRDVALRLLMARHGAAIFRFCCEALHDATLADDVLQRVFIGADAALGTFGRRSTVRTWLFGIARHRVLDAAKSRRRADARIEETDPTEIPDLAPPPSAVLDDVREQDALVACLRELDPDVQTALLLRYQQDMTYEEMAVVCDEKAGTLHARVARALPVLRAGIERRLGRARTRRPR